MSKPRTADEIFADALERTGAERGVFLDEACRGAPEVRAEVQSLLEAHAGAGVFLETPPVASDQRIGRYRLLDIVGTGGMGTVYRGERVGGDFEQRVAVKVMRRGLDTDDLMQRFRRERRVLAGLEHPNIARLIDGGASEDGRPYLVMEFVAGVPIDTYCDDHKLGTRERLEIFRQVCAAVQYAHQNLVVHRDLKPGNILVTADEQVKLLDFGIAKVLAGEGASERTIDATATGTQLMTPRYASPEQVRGETITTATDVYALGVILYELLTGRMPYAFTTGTRAEYEKLICEQDPPRPSTTARRLAGDLDTIVLKTLRKEPERRYSSPQQLSDDLGRYLDGLPVLARPDTLGYRVHKFVARNRLLVGAAAALVLLLVAGVVVSSIGFLRATAAAEEARRQQFLAERTSAFLQNMLATVKPDAAQGRDVTVLRELVDDAAERVTGELADVPEVAATIHLTISSTYFAIGLFEESREHALIGLELREALFDADSVEVANAHKEVGSVVFRLGEYEMSETHLQQALDAYRAAEPRDDRKIGLTLYHLSMTVMATGDYPRGEALVREALAILRETLGDDALDVAEVRKWLSSTLTDLNNLEEAETELDEVMRIYRIHLGELDHRVANGFHVLGWLRKRAGRYEESEAAYRRGLEIKRQILDPGHADLASSIGALASSLEHQERYEEAETLYHEALEIARRELGDSHRAVGTSLNNLAGLCRKTGRYDEAETFFVDALAVYRTALGSEHVWTSIVLENLARLHEMQADYAAAEPYVDECVRVRELVWPDGAWLLWRARTLHGACLAARGDYDTAEPLILDSYERLTKDRGPDHKATHDAARRAAAMYEWWGREDDAARFRAMLD